MSYSYMIILGAEASLNSDSVTLIIKTKNRRPARPASLKVPPNFNLKKSIASPYRRHFAIATLRNASFFDTVFFRFVYRDMIFPEISAHQLHGLTTVENLVKSHPKSTDVHKKHRFRYAVSCIYLRRVDFLCTNIDWNFDEKASILAWFLLLLPSAC